jgi:hypothetical protein
MTEQEQRHADQQQNHSDAVWDKVMIAAVIGLLSWNLMTTQQLAVDVAVLTEKIGRIEETLKP